LRKVVEICLSIVEVKDIYDGDIKEGLVVHGECPDLAVLVIIHRLEGGVYSGLFAGTRGLGI
jgi:hypothetical protein